MSLPRFLLLALLLALAGCREGAPERAESPSRAAVVELRDDPDHPFRARVPRLAPGDGPSHPIRLERILGDTGSFGAPMFLLPVGPRLLVADQLTDPHLVLIELEGGTIVARFGVRGGGPGEFRHPDWGFVQGTVPAEVWLYDFENRRFTLVRVEPEEAGRVVEELPLHLARPVESPVWVGGRILANGLFPDHTLVEVSHSGRIEREIVADPPFDEAALPHGAGRALMNRTFLAADPSRRRIVLAYQFVSRLDFFTSGGARYGSLEGPRETVTRFQVRDGRFLEDGANEMAYGPVAASDRLVYALFCGCREDGEITTDRVHVFTWAGEFVAELGLEHPLHTLAVSPDDTRLWGVFEDPYPRVGEWTLPPALGGTGSAPRGNPAARSGAGPDLAAVSSPSPPGTKARMEAP